MYKKILLCVCFISTIAFARGFNLSIRMNGEQKHQITQTILVHKDHFYMQLEDDNFLGFVTAKTCDDDDKVSVEVKIFEKSNNYELVESSIFLLEDGQYGNIRWGKKVDGKKSSLIAVISPALDLRRE